MQTSRRLGFIWYHINLFELFYTDFYHHRIDRIDDKDRQYMDSWKAYIRSFLRESAEAQTVVDGERSMMPLHPEFREYLRGCLPS